MKKTLWQKFIPTVLVLVALALLTGCDKIFPDYGVIAGETVDIRPTFICYISSGPTTYRKLSAGIENLVLTDPKWTLDDGLVLLDSDLGGHYGEISWEENNTQTTVEGVTLMVPVSVGVAEGATKGWKSVYVHLPSLATIAGSLGGTAMCSSFDDETPQNYNDEQGIKVVDVKVYGSKASKILAESLRTLLIIIFAAFVVISLIRKN